MPLRRTNISWDTRDAVVDEWMRVHAANRSAAIRELIRAAEAARTATPAAGMSEEDRAALIDRVVAEVLARLRAESIPASAPAGAGGQRPTAGESPIDPDRHEELRRRAAKTAGRFLA